MSIKCPTSLSMKLQVHVCAADAKFDSQQAPYPNQPRPQFIARKNKYKITFYSTERTVVSPFCRWCLKLMWNCIGFQAFLSVAEMTRSRQNHHRAALQINHRVHKYVIKTALPFALLKEQETVVLFLLSEKASWVRCTCAQLGAHRRDPVLGMYTLGECCSLVRVIRIANLETVHNQNKTSKTFSVCTTRKDIYMSCRWNQLYGLYLRAGSFLVSDKVQHLRWLTNCFPFRQWCHIRAFQQDIEFI